MEMHQVCTQCKGKKKHIPLGFMEVECSLCRGYGFTDKALMPVMYPLDNKIDITKRPYKKKPNAMEKLKSKIEDSI